ncbi:MAG: hypothetical protein QM831_32145 [Kofleriaceae bacterium]
MRIISALVLALTVPACMDQPEVSDEALSSDGQDLDNCPAAGGLNDTLTVGSGIGASDSYTRPGSATCTNYVTKVKVNMSAAPSMKSGTSTCLAASEIDVTVGEGEWGLNTDGQTDDKTECENSTLSMTVVDSHGNSIPVYNNGLIHPVWNGYHCKAAELWSANSTNFPQTAGTYTVTVKAVRGLEQYHHGYARHTITADHSNEWTCF